MIDEIKSNVETEIRMLREVSSYIRKFNAATETDEKRLLQGALTALIEGIKILNGSIPELLKEVSITQKIVGKNNKDLERIKVKNAGSGIEVVLNSRQKENFLRELDISEKFVRKLKRREIDDRENYEEFKASRGYLKLANGVFGNLARKTSDQDSLKELKENLRKANIDILFEGYLAMTYLTVLISFFVGIFVFLGALFFTGSPNLPFVTLRDGGYLDILGKIFWIPLGLPILTFLAFYFYPTTEKQSIGSKIDQELPFAVIHMSAISGSGIEPSEIFKIIGLNREYPFLRKEIRKVLNQINLYGYDLNTALINASKTAPSDKLAELFAGLATSISSGTDLSDFFEKRSETLLLSYRLEREKYTKLVETFLDIYISIVIAAPMVFLLLLIMMAISGINIGLNPSQISLLAVSSIAALNILFLVFLQLRQPAY